MDRDLTKGPVVKSMLLFAIPLILGDLLQQCYNIADTLIVGQFLGRTALAAVGSSFTLMTFLTSIILGLCMGSGALFSIRFGQRDEEALREDLCASFFFVALITVLLDLASFACLPLLRKFLQVPDEVWGDMRAYLAVVFMGIPAVFLYNFFASYLRAIGNSVIPLIFLAVSSVLNIALDLWFVIGLKRGVAGAGEATVIAQYLSGVGIAVYALGCYPQLRSIWALRYLKRKRVREIISFSTLTCIQQSVMNLGILMVQGIVNSFGTVVMAAFAAAVKIDAFAYMPVQDFGNAFSTFIAQNYGAKESERIRSGLKSAVWISVVFCLVISAVVFAFAKPLMSIFVDSSETAVIAEGVRYLRIEGAFYCGIGCLFLLYGLYRALGRPGMSVVLTVISLGTRVALAYILSAIPTIGVVGIWWSVPIGWALADLTGLLYYKFHKKQLLALE
jgi:putative MATE family efflux protein